MKDLKNIDDDMPINFMSDILTKLTNMESTFDIRYGGISDDLKEIKLHLSRLNGQVAKHSEWINKYDIRVNEDFPRVREKVDNLNAKLAGVGATIGTVSALVSFLLSRI